MSTGQRDIPYHMTSSGRGFGRGGSSSHSLPCLAIAWEVLSHCFYITSYILSYICVCVCVRASITSVLFSTFGKRFLSTHEFRLLFFPP